MSRGYMTYDEVHAYLEKEVQPLRDKTGQLETDFAKLFARMERRFDELDSQKADKADIDLLYNQLDGLIKRIDQRTRLSA